MNTPNSADSSDVGQADSEQSPTSSDESPNDASAGRPRAARRSVDDKADAALFANANDMDEPPVRLAFDPRVLVHPVVLRGLIATIAILFVALAPQASSAVIATIAVGGLIITGLLSIVGALLRKSTHSTTEIGFGGGLIAIAVAYLLWAQEPAYAVPRMFALVLVIVALRSILRSMNGGNGIGFGTAAVSLLAAALLWLFPTQLVAIIMVIAGVIALGSTIASILELSQMTPAQRNAASAVELTSDWIQGRALPLPEREDLYAKVIFEGKDYGTRVARFYTLMAFAAVIASMGVITDSTAVVIGAMLIAPLMTPLMGIAASLAMGWPNRLGRSAFVAVTGILLAILIGVALGQLFHQFVDLQANTQIQARIAPTLRDLLTAIAAGGAGAYGLSRSDVSDSLPGVAIAISLVPPLTVVGICYGQGGWTQGTGALLLFLTNAVAIMIVGAVTFVVTGMAPVAQSAGGQHRVRRAAITIAVLAALVLGGLMLNGRQALTQVVAEGQIRGVVNDWIGEDTGFQLVNITIGSNDTIQIAMSGPADAEPLSSDNLAADLTKELGRPVRVEVQTVLTRAQTSSAG